MQRACRRQLPVPEFFRGGDGEDGVVGRETFCDGIEMDGGACYRMVRSGHASSHVGMKGCTHLGPVVSNPRACT